DVLFGERVNRIRRGEATNRHADRIQPQSHGVFALAKNENVGNAGYALQRVLDINVQVITHEQGIVATVRGIDSGAENEVLRTLGDGNAGGFDGAGQTSLRSIHTVLDVDGR